MNKSIDNQPSLFEEDFVKKEFEGKSIYAIRHIVVRQRQKENADAVHHPGEKEAQIERVLPPVGEKPLKILELFAGRGNCTKVYERYGKVWAYDKKWLGTGDSFREFHRLIADRKTFDVVDVDPYGFPSRLLPDVFLLLKKGYLFMTFPKPYVNIMNRMNDTHMISYFGDRNPSVEVIAEKVALFGLCHWRKVELIDVDDLKSVWRFVFAVERVKATDYTGLIYNK